MRQGVLDYLGEQFRRLVRSWQKLKSEETLFHAHARRGPTHFASEHARNLVPRAF